MIDVGEMDTKASNEPLRQANELLPSLVAAKERAAVGPRAELEVRLAEAYTAELYSVVHTLREGKHALAETGNKLKTAVSDVTASLDRASEASGKQAEALVFWTRIMVGAIVAQALAALAMLFG